MTFLSSSNAVNVMTLAFALIFVVAGGMSAYKAFKAKHGDKVILSKFNDKEPQ